MTAPQDDAPPPAPWASPAGASSHGPASPPPAAPPPAAPPGGAPVAPGAPAWGPAPGAAGAWGAPPPPASGWGAAPTPPAWGAAPPPAGPGWQGGAPGGAGPTGWRAPSLQPGIVPLRPLGLGEILDGAVRAVRANPSVMFGLSAVVVTVAVAIQTVVQLYVTGLLSGAIGDAFRMDGVTPAESAALSEMLSTNTGAALTAPLLVPVTSVLTGLLIVSVSRSVIGQRVALREVTRSRRVWLVVGFGLLQLLASVVAVGLWIGGVVGLAAAGTPGGAVLLTLVGGLALAVGTVWVTARTLLVPPALMLEGRRFWPTVARAWRLTRGSFWRLLGIYLLASVLVSVLMYLFVLPAGVVAGLVSAATGSRAVLVLVTALGQIVGMTLSTTFMAAVVALLYVDVRIRREGLDLELARAATADA
ncbi:glycerophosphoryl diester phosphodiesterase membrane domain-containing protein [Cellulomonas iranensis]|uniref:glycerophosphoryl diester phosphodiesterase membrane domain-containing protein n=1 Tax=Cellulomonas iranensis TaxID=76862 RepID=UPI003D7E06A1